MNAAFFDVDGTLTKSNVVEAFVDFKLCQLPAPWRWLWLLSFLLKIPYYIAVDKVSRSLFNEVFYRNYAGVDASQLKAWSQDYLERVLRGKIFPEALTELENRRREGALIVLVTGGLRLVVEPLAEFLHADCLLAADMKEENGRLAGVLVGAPLGEREKARLVQEFVEFRGVDLSKSYAYADSIADRFLLELVGHPVAVNPDKKLRQLAEERGWRVCEWGVRR